MNYQTSTPLVGPPGTMMYKWGNGSILTASSAENHQGEIRDFMCLVGFAEVVPAAMLHKELADQKLPLRITNRGSGVLTDRCCVATVLGA